MTLVAVSEIQNFTKTLYLKHHTINTTINFRAQPKILHIRSWNLSLPEIFRRKCTQFWFNFYCDATEYRLFDYAT